MVSVRLVFTCPFYRKMKKKRYMKRQQNVHHQRKRIRMQISEKPKAVHSFHKDLLETA
jgi:hypothetical protein